MRSIWSGSITFGMVSIPVKLYTATEDKSVSFKQVHRECGQAIKQRRLCPTCDVTVEFGDINKGYPMGGDQILMMDEGDFLNLPLQSMKAVDVNTFAPEETVPPLALEKSYYVKPDGVGGKPFRLLWEALGTEELPLVALGKVALRSGKESLCVLRRHGRLLLMQTLLWPDEIRSPAGLEEDMGDTPIDDAELQLAHQLVRTMLQDDAKVVMAEQKDDYREALLNIIQLKLEGKELPTAVAPPAPPAPDLMKALTESVAQAKAEAS